MNNKIGIYYAFWEQQWAADYFKYVDKVSALGFDVLELAAGALPEMSRARRIDLAKAAGDAGIELSYCIGLPHRYDLASEDANVRRAGIAYVRTLLKCVHEMGGKILGGIIYGSWPGAPEFGMTDKRPMLERSLSSVRELVKTAEDCGIDYCLEIVNRFEQCLLNTAREGMAYVDEVGSPACKLLLDAFHMNIEEDFIGEAIRGAGKYIGHFHIGEPNRRVPGRGRMPWGEIMDALRDVDYQGRIVMEPFLRMGGEVGGNIKVWRDLSDGMTDAQMDAEARFALDFMRAREAERS